MIVRKDKDNDKDRKKYRNKDTQRHECWGKNTWRKTKTETQRQECWRMGTVAI